GRKYYEINCSVCHGPAGAGDGPALRYGVAAPSLLTDRAKGLSDGYYWGIIRNGRVSMPSYDRIETMDRWDLINYIRGLQGLAGQTVPTGPLGAPGETGKTVPGASLTGPTRPAPYENPGSSTAVETRLLTNPLPPADAPASAARADTGTAARPGAPATDTTRRAVPQGGRP
ncbi:MAG TPA: cytochrome c, partial [Gemmatimonadaceae bacterium]|nr:cytochrome c [Gemmatimonadaceae bacterium]